MTKRYLFGSLLIIRYMTKALIILKTWRYISRLLTYLLTCGFRRRHEDGHSRVIRIRGYSLYFRFFGQFSRTYSEGKTNASSSPPQAERLASYRRNFEIPYNYVTRSYETVHQDSRMLTTVKVQPHRMRCVAVRCGDDGKHRNESGMIELRRVIAMESFVGCSRIYGIHHTNTRLVKVTVK